MKRTDIGMVAMLTACGCSSKPSTASGSTEETAVFDVGSDTDDDTAADSESSGDTNSETASDGDSETDSVIECRLPTSC